MTVYSLDLETASTSKSDNPYALEPFRYRQGKAEITSAALAGPQNTMLQLHKQGEGTHSLRHFKDLLTQLAGHEVIAHNAIFDVAWCIEVAGLETVKKIKWRDSMGLAKWVNNGQDAEMPKKSYALASLVAEYLVGHPMYDEFLDVKAQQVQPGENYEYWLKRGRMDATVTRDLYMLLMTTAPESMINGYILEQGVIVPVANSWNHGINLNKEKAAALKPKIAKLKKKLADKLGKPATVFTSPKQLAAYLYDEIGIQPLSMTPSGKPSTKADDLKMMVHKMAGTKNGSIIKTVLDFKQVSTLETKFINGIINVCDYVGEDINHSAPRMFGTYTGRFTYSSKTLKPKYKPGIATHQLPRKGPTRDLLEAPEGYVVGELDAAAQEMRGMAMESGDIALLDGFNKGLDLHGGMGAEISGESYEGYMKRYKASEDDAVNFRYAGKLLNLSCQYRIGNNALASKFFTTYGIIINNSTAASYLSMYKKRYPGVVQYWEDAIRKGKINGYAETVAGRRFNLNKWSRFRWQTESSAINFPIQGFGAEHKALAISKCFEVYPEAIFMLDLHDGLWYAVPEAHSNELLLDMRDYISNLPFGDIWGADIPLALPFDAQIGTTFGNVKEINR